MHKSNAFILNELRALKDTTLSFLATLGSRRSKRSLGESGHTWNDTGEKRLAYVNKDEGRFTVGLQLAPISVLFFSSPFPSSRIPTRYQPHHKNTHFQQKWVECASVRLFPLRFFLLQFATSRAIHHPTLMTVCVGKDVSGER